MAELPIRVLLADGDAATLEVLGNVLERHGFAVSFARSPREAIAALRTEDFAAVVTDVVFDGVCSEAQVQLAAHDLQPWAIVIVMTSHPVLENAVSAIRSGALDYLSKPVDAVALAAALHRALRERSLRQSDLQFSELVEILSRMVATTIERIDPYTAGHGERTRRYCDLLAQRIGLEAPVREKLQLAAIAHDYGKIYLDDLSFLTKPGPLTASEYEEVRRHPALGAKKLGNHERLREVCAWIAEHHEKWDGTGYPLRRKGEQISMPGRILGIVEVFDSLATRRSYKEAWGLGKVLDYFERQRGVAFDPLVLDRFLRVLETEGEAWLRQPEVDRQQAVNAAV